MAITRSVTGVDLGRDSIKAVQVELSGAEASILRSVSIPRVRLEGQDPQSVAAALGDAMEQAGIPTNGVTLGLGGEDSILRYNHIPPQASAKLPLIMQYEVESVSERMGESVASDFKQLPAIRDDGERTVLLGLAREEALSETLEALEAEGIVVANAVPSSLAVYGAWEMVATKADLDSPEDDLVLIVDLGRSILDVALVLNNRLVFARSTTFGGDQFTEALAGELDATMEQAETVKVQRGGVDDSLKGVDDRTVRPLRTAAGQLLGMLESSVRVGGSQAGIGLPDVTRLWLAGGGMRLKGLPRYLATGLGKLREEVFDPAGPSDEEGAGGSFTTALGLSAVGLQSGRSGDSDVILNILPKQYSDRQVFRDRTRFLLVAATLLFLLLCARFADGWMQGSKVEKMHTKLKGQKSSLDKQMAEKKGWIEKNNRVRSRINRLLREGEPTVFQAFVLDYLSTNLPAEIQLEMVDLEVDELESEDGIGAEMKYVLAVKGRANNEKGKGTHLVLKLRDDLLKQKEHIRKVDNINVRSEPGAWYSFLFHIEPKYQVLSSGTSG
ncbi:MAG: pilus assembly protein PilM [Planctomycetota bacterium]|nr:pilus assembly protein PilM [Planctomycetota bacterium]